MSDPLLILDNRAALVGKPVMHAVLIGVSEYTNLPDADDPPGDGLLALRKLRSSAMTVMRLADKLRTLDTAGRLVRPLATIRLLVAPSAVEITAEPALGGQFTAPTIANIELALLDWRDDVAQLRDNQAVFFFSGHGIRSSLEESILLAQDFLQPRFAEMSRSFRLSNIRNGMVPSQKFSEIGREQFYFIDACRDRPEALGGIDPIDPPAIFTADLNIYDDRKAPIFFATTTGGIAAAEPGKPTFFGNAMLWAMENGSFGKQPVPGITGSVWPVNASSLKAGIEVADALFDARVELTGLVSNPVLCFRRDAPEMILKVALEPADRKAEVATLSITEMNTNMQTDFVPVATDAMDVRIVGLAMSADGSITWGAVDAGLGPLPVKIRTADGEMIGSGVSGAPIAVPAGKYFVSVVQPDGRERGTNNVVTVEAGEDSKVGLQPQTPPAPPPSLRMAAMMPMAAPAGFAMAAAPLAEAEHPPFPINTSPGEIVDSWLWKGDWFASWDSGQAARQAEVLSAGLGSAVPLSENVPMVITKPQSGDQLLALRVPGATRYSVVPFDECTACVGEMPNAQEIAASLTLVGDTPNVQFRSTVAEETNTLLSFVANGVLTEMWAVSQDMVNQGEQAMYGAGGSLLRAVTGAYVLLRANQMDGLDAWLRMINGLSPSLPDIPILRAELLARLGQHDDALDILRTAIGGRVPWFRSGLSYMLERVRLYIDVSANSAVPFRISEDEMPRFVEARDRLQRLMLVLVRGRVMATFDVPDTPKP